MGLSTGSAMHIREGYSVVIIQLNIYDLNREFNLLNKIKKRNKVYCLLNTGLDVMYDFCFFYLFSRLESRSHVVELSNRESGTNC